MMRRLFSISSKVVILILIFKPMSSTASAVNTLPSCSNIVSCRVKQILWQGNSEIYFTGYAWHNRYTYSKSKLKTYNELAFGGGYGKGFYDEDGDWHGISMIAFLDSHSNVEPALGYAFLKVAQFGSNIRLGGGYAIVATVRPDILHGIPFVGVIPWSSLNYRQLTLSATYIPGSKGTGNVLFLSGKWTLPL